MESSYSKGEETRKKNQESSSKWETPPPDNPWSTEDIKGAKGVLIQQERTTRLLEMTVTKVAPVVWQQ